MFTDEPFVAVGWVPVKLTLPVKVVPGPAAALALVLVIPVMGPTCVVRIRWPLLPMPVLSTPPIIQTVSVAPSRPLWFNSVSAEKVSP